MKTYDCFVCETREFRQFYYRSDADKFAAERTRQGFHVLRATGFVEN